MPSPHGLLSSCAELARHNEVYTRMRFQVVSAPSTAPVDIGAILSLHEAAQLCEVNTTDLAFAGSSPAGIISPDGEIRLKICDGESERETFIDPATQRRYCCAAFTEAADCLMIKVNSDGTYCVHGTGIVAAAHCPWCGRSPTQGF